MANITVTVGTNTTREKIMVGADSTPKQVLEAADVDYGPATIHLDGGVIGFEEMNKTFAQLGCGDTALLIAVIKSDNA